MPKVQASTLVSVRPRHLFAVMLMNKISKSKSSGCGRACLIQVKDLTAPEDSTPA